MLGQIMGSLFGNGSDSGILGTGQFQADRYNLDRNAFDPNNQEQSFTDALMARANGNAPSAAEMQMRQGADLAQANAASMAASARGVSPAMAARMAAEQQQALAQQNNQATGQLRANEQAQSQGLLAQALQSQRQGRMSREQLGVEQQAGMNQVNQTAYGDAAKRRQDLVGGIGSGIMSMLPFNQGGLVPGYAGGGFVGYGDSNFDFDQLSAKATSPPMFGSPNDVPIPSPMASAPVGMPTASPGGIPNDLSSGFAAGLQRLKEQQKKQANMSAQPQMNGGQMLGQAFGGLLGRGAGMLFAADGAMVPGRPAVPGDSPANDTVPAMLSPGEMVVPRTVVAGGPNAVEDFARALMSRRV